MSQRTILVIDDDIDLVEIIRVTLEHEGLNVIDAQNGARGLELARSENPDLIILDVMMGQLDEGFQVAYELRKGETTRDVPILMLTAVADQTGFDFDPKKDSDSCRSTSSWKADQSQGAGGSGAQAPATGI